MMRNGFFNSCENPKLSSFYYLSSIVMTHRKFKVQNKFCSETFIIYLGGARCVVETDRETFVLLDSRSL